MVVLTYLFITSGNKTDQSRVLLFVKMLSDRTHTNSMF